MVRSRLDSDDLPYILEGDDEPQRPTFDDSDDFDPSALLSQPLFNDIDEELNTSTDDFLNDPVAISEASSASSGSQLQQQQQQQFQQQQQQQQNPGFQTQQQPHSSFFQAAHQPEQSCSQPGSPSYTGMPQNMSVGGSQSPLNQMGSFEPKNVSTGMSSSSASRIQEVQSRIQQVQEQIQRVQIASNPSLMGQGQPPRQPPFQVAGMMNSAGGMRSSRSPPGRSVSMPLRRNPNMQGNTMNQPTFMMQQPMQNLQQQQAMMGTSMDGSVNSAMSNMNNSMNNSINNVNATNNSFGNMNNFGQTMDNGNVPSLVGFNPNMNNMMQQNMTDMNSLNPTPFADNGHATHQNSLSQANTMGMMGGQTPGMMQTGGFDPSQLQQAFQTTQAQGLLPGGSPGQGGQGVNEAMEKLCETMRRSAMSRSMVKQLSGRSLTKQHSNRSLSRQNSGRLTKQISGRNLARANSGRSLNRANSGRSLQRTASGRQMMESGELPIRRMSVDHKHRIHRDAVINNQGPPGRGVFRHKSQSAIMGASKTVLNIDGNTVGMF